LYVERRETIRTLFAILIFANLLTTNAHASCVPDSINSGKAALNDVPDDKRVELTAKTLKMACNWPRDIELALVGIFQAPPDYQPSIDLSTAIDYPELWNRVCIGGRATLDQAVKLSANEARTHIYKQCGVERIQFATLEEFVAADGPFLLPLMIMAVLDSYGMDFDSRRALSRGLAGIGVRELDAAVPDQAPAIPPPTTSTPPSPPAPPPAPVAPSTGN
jgi:hypothetical protein